MPTPELVERVARAITVADETAPSPDSYIYIGMKAAWAWQARVPQAKAALKAHEEWLAEQGLEIWPRKITKEWCENMAKREDGSEIGAGLLAMDPIFDDEYKAEVDKAQGALGSFNPNEILGPKKP